LVSYVISLGIEFGTSEGNRNTPSCCF